MIDALKEIHDNLNRRPTTQNEHTFFQKYKSTLTECESYITLFEKYNCQNLIFQAWYLYKNLHEEIQNNIRQIKEIYLKNVSPDLLNCKNCEVVIPGTYYRMRPSPKIAAFHSHLTILPSKRRPRKLSIYGDDGKIYQFL